MGRRDETGGLDRSHHEDAGRLLRLRLGLLDLARRARGPGHLPHHVVGEVAERRVELKERGRKRAEIRVRGLERTAQVRDHERVEAEFVDQPLLLAKARGRKGADLGDDLEDPSPNVIVGVRRRFGCRRGRRRVDRRWLRRLGFCGRRGDRRGRHRGGFPNDGLEARLQVGGRGAFAE